jgi:hypothetical protein
MRIPKEKLEKLRECLKGTKYGSVGASELQINRQYIYDVANGKRQDERVIEWLSKYALRMKPSESVYELLDKAIA